MIALYGCTLLLSRSALQYYIHTLFKNCSSVKQHLVVKLWFYKIAWHACNFFGSFSGHIPMQLYVAHKWMNLATQVTVGIFLKLDERI